MLQSSFDVVFGKIQDLLNFQFIQNVNYLPPKGIGKIGVVGYLLGVGSGISGMYLYLSCFYEVPSSWSRDFTTGSQTVLVGDFITLFCFISLISFYSQFSWFCYLLSLTLFHFLEFFVTSLFQPSTLSYDCTNLFFFLVDFINTVSFSFCCKPF
jgi:hypothetical protein